MKIHCAGRKSVWRHRWWQPLDNTKRLDWQKVQFIPEISFLKRGWKKCDLKFKYSAPFNKVHCHITLFYYIVCHYFCQSSLFIKSLCQSFHQLWHCRMNNNIKPSSIHHDAITKWSFLPRGNKIQRWWRHKSLGKLFWLVITLLPLVWNPKIILEFFKGKKNSSMWIFAWLPSTGDLKYFLFQIRCTDSRKMRVECNYCTQLNKVQHYLRIFGVHLTSLLSNKD